MNVDSDERVENMDVWKERIQNKVNMLEQKYERTLQHNTVMQNDIHKLEVSDQLQNKEIVNIKSTLSDIKDDTTWIKRTITGAIIIALIGGMIALAFQTIF